MGFEFEQGLDNVVNIKVIGVGGGGGNAVNRMVENGVQGVEFVSINTDMQALNYSQASTKIQIGEKLTKGQGAGANPEIGRKAAEESKDQIAAALANTNMVFITAGMGGGTGTGAAPVIAEIAKELGILTVAVVTKPFSFEGQRRMRTAEKGIESLKDKVDSMIVILNEKLEEECPPNATMKECFETSNEVLYKACVGIAEIIHTPGNINVDFEDIKTVMSERGTAIIGLATASGPDRARIAAEKAIACPLLEGANLQGARGMLVYFTGNESLTLAEIREAMGVLNTFTHKQATVIFGSALSEAMGDEVRVTVVATGLDRPFDVSEMDGDEVVAAQPAQSVFAGAPSIPPFLASGSTPSAAPKAAAPAPESAPAAQPAQEDPAGISIPSYTIPTYLRTPGGAN